MPSNKAWQVLAAAPDNNAVKDAAEILVTPLTDVQDLDEPINAVNLAPSPHEGFDLDTTHLISSPYSNSANQLQLSPLDLQSRLFAFALTALKPIRSDYATAPYLESFNWPEVLSTLRTLCLQAEIQWEKQDFYVVIFRSKLLADADRVRLGELDQKSHEEACTSGSLLHYWFGSTDTERRNLATCAYHPLPLARS